MYIFGKLWEDQSIQINVRGLEKFLANFFKPTPPTFFEDLQGCPQTKTLEKERIFSNLNLKIICLTDLQRCLEDFDSLFALPSGGLLTEEEANSTRITLCESGALISGEITVLQVGDPLLEHVRYFFK